MGTGPEGLVASSVACVAIASVLAVFGFAMAPLSIATVAGVLVASVAFAFVLDVLKVRVFRHLRIMETGQ